MDDLKLHIFRKKLLFFVLIAFYSGFYSCSSNDERVEIVQEREEVLPLRTEELESPYVLFTDPKKISVGSNSTIIMDRLVNFINAAPEGSTVHMSIFLFEYRPVVNALKNAHSRNVDLHIMADASSRSSNSGTLKELRDLGEGVEIVEIRNDASSIAINHNKFVIFSKLTTDSGEVNNVIYQTSHNFVGSGMKKIQDAQILIDREVYNAYYNYWQNMSVLGSGGMINYEYSEYNNDQEDLEILFYPKRKNGSRYGEDTVIELLNSITEPQETTITIGMSDWSDSRVHIVDKLSELLTAGATIEVITKSGKGDVINQALRNLEQNGAYVKMFNMENNGIQKINVHIKVMLIEGVFQGENTTIVMTGTQNFTNNAIWNNNEISLLFYNHNFFETYKQYFEVLKDLSGIEIPQ